ncbi:hypothetical protein CS022_19065 [Veronia nyctiphanis]|uniref:DUF3899 domain-containing protein n=1 Tax=Veronia nyctiphanis TaxID=1278244 RepID=A0A4V1LSJ0_9GAMM|nr:hypothetical protein [Veronia nyctiphanis]RXJ71868.1 hypothetical protein CS022_19065 [Veronia nyctiphanis]
MLDLLKKVIIINAIAAIVVFVLSQYVPFFATTRLSDFLFLVTIIIWILAKLMWQSGNGVSKPTSTNKIFTEKADSMVEGHNVAKDRQAHAKMNFQLGMVLFISGFPAFITCLALYFI